MIESLTKYTQGQNIALKQSSLSDARSPYNFQQWRDRNIGIIPGREYKQYQNYLREWYAERSNEPTTADKIKQDYIQVLKQLTLTFKSEADATWATDIDFDDPIEVEQVIPFYATKLKEIAIYLINKREAVRRAKLKYNMTGTYRSLERVFYEYLLKAFTKKRFPGNEYITTITDVSVFNAIPELSAVKSDFQIFVEELYDDASYFDRDPGVPVSSCFTFNSDVSTYLETLNITIDDLDWLYSTGVTQLCADNPLLWSVDSVLLQYQNGIPLSAVELYGSDLLNDYNRLSLTKKYIGEQQYILSGGYWVPWINTIDFKFAPGNNWFYWLSGENIIDTSQNIVDPIPLTATNLIASSATAGLELSGADIIYVSRNNQISGAWLSLKNQTAVTPVMSAVLRFGKTTFAFPYPGYGLSGEDLEWTGKTLDNIDQNFFYLDKDMQKAVWNAYWNTDTSAVSSFSPLYLYDTNLIDSGSRAGSKFNDADYIMVRNDFYDSVKDEVYTGKQQYAWLYKMSKTDIPVAVGSNKIYWPFERYEGTITTTAKSNQCAAIKLTTLGLDNFIGSVAGITPETADIIYKKDSPQASEYIEGAWLKGELYSTPPSIKSNGAELVSGCTQPNLSMRIYGGEYGSFIWQDSNTPADQVFKTFKHQNDCQYLKNKQFSIYGEHPSQNKDLDYNQWQTCSCRSILYTPLGHPGNTFDDYGQMADVIMSVSNPMSAFDYTTWKGIDGKSYKESSSFGWFRLSGDYSVEPDVGWGSGSWVTYTGEPFMLSSNIMYLYYRTSLHRDNPVSNVPYLIVKYSSPQLSTNATWTKLIYDKTTNRWIDADVPSDMIISPGNLLEYIHADTYSIVLTSLYMTCSAGQSYSSTISYNVTANDISLDTTGTITINTPSAASINAVKYIYKNNAVNFMLNVTLSGWLYDSEIGGRPFWAYATDDDNEYTKGKGIDIWGGSPVLVDEYNFITQPKISDIVLEDNTYIEYTKRFPGIITWTQPVECNVSINEKQWKKLIFDTEGVSNLSSVLFNNVNDLIISATDIVSDIVFSTEQDNLLLVNYYARNAFTWSQELSDSSLGLPPTGGVWVPVQYSELVTPLTPYAYISNRHYPTYASAPHVGEMYTTKDKGGYFIPQMLGASTAFSKHVNSTINTSKIDNVPSKRGMRTIFRDIDIYTSDRGLSHTDQITPVHLIDIDSSWMKGNITEGKKNGMIIGGKDHQEFMPYQTKYESIKSNTNGVFQQGVDVYDPWFGELDDAWENIEDWPSNKRGQYFISDWYKQFERSGIHVYQWKTDIFGNQYALLKPINQNYTYYDMKHTVNGVIWTRDLRNVIKPGTESLSEVFNVIENNYNTNRILDFDIWYDTLMVYTTGGLYFFHLNYDYDTGRINSTPGEVNYIETTNSKFGNTWFFEENKTVTVCTLLSCGDQIRPVLRTLNLDTNIMTYLYSVTSELTDMSEYSFTRYEHPVFTYDYVNRVYNISYIAYNDSGNFANRMFVTTINLKDHGDCFKIIDRKTIQPET